MGTPSPVAKYNCLVTWSRTQLLLLFVRDSRLGLSAFSDAVTGPRMSRAKPTSPGE